MKHITTTVYWKYYYFTTITTSSYWYVLLLIINISIIIILFLVNEREISPSKTVALVGIGLGLYDNIIIHSVNNILIPLPMINSVNVKKIDT